MAGSKKARMRSLARHVGEVGTDPFIPARQPHASSAVPTQIARTPATRQRRLSWAVGRLVAGFALAAVGVWAAVFEQPALAASVRALHVLPTPYQGAAVVGVALVAFGIGLALGIWGGLALRRR